MRSTRTSNRSTPTWARSGRRAGTGLSVIQAPADAEPGRLALTTFLLHSSGEFLSTTYSMKLAQDTAHGAGSALTYLRRYALASLVGVVADEDDDGNSASQQPQRQQAWPAVSQSRQSAQPATNGHQNGASYEPPTEEPAPAKKPPTKEGVIKRIRALWTEERDLGGQAPAAELATDLEAMDLEQLIAAGKKLASRVEGLKAARDIEGQRAMPEERLPDTLPDVRQKAA
jgi:hypothetical protein